MKKAFFLLLFVTLLTNGLLANMSFRLPPVKKNNVTLSSKNRVTLSSTNKVVIKKANLNTQFKKVVNKPFVVCDTWRVPICDGSTAVMYVSIRVCAPTFQQEMDIVDDLLWCD